jgi:hypothetical protein
MPSSIGESNLPHGALKNQLRKAQRDEVAIVSNHHQIHLQFFS